MHTIFEPKNLNGRDHFENRGVDGIILKWALRKLCYGLDSVDSG
jgi:hypothetical protein